MRDLIVDNIIDKLDDMVFGGFYIDRTTSCIILKYSEGFTINSVNSSKDLCKILVNDFKYEIYDNHYIYAKTKEDVIKLLNIIKAYKENKIFL